ncbi:MAG: efflux RND transporter periplasmic adaptor subunit [Acidimicrobiales bacterium]
MPTTTWFRGARQRNRIVVTSLVIVLIAAAVAVFMVTGSKSKRFVTATVSYANVSQIVDTTGTIAAVGEVNLPFGEGGRVALVPVSVGQKVKAGQVLASLDTTAYAAQLAASKASLADAESTLFTLTNGPTPTELATANAAIATASDAVQAATTSLNDTEAVNAAALASAQQLLQSAQTAEANDTTTLQSAQAAATSACAGAPTSTQCQAAQAQVNAAQAQVAKDQAAVGSAQLGVSSTVARNTQVQDQAQAQLTAAQTQLANANAALSAMRSAPTPPELASAQAAVAAAQSQVAADSVNLASAVIKAPADGVIAAVNIVANQIVGSTGAPSGGSSSTSSAAAATNGSTAANPAAIVLIEPAGFQAVTQVSDAQVGLVSAGETALVTPAGATRPIQGTVTQVATLATVSSGVANFGVTVALPSASTGLYAGSTADVELVVRQISNTLTIPTSAVHTSGSRNYVMALENGHATRVHVSIGITDGPRTQVLSGLSAGEVVVIADIAKPLPSVNAKGGFFGGKGGKGGGPLGGGGGGRKGGPGAAGFGG